ncbi:MAG: hypothetical protein PW844_20850 [Pantoea sp.]|uniref:ArsC/Spx/MgsR family protein n=1 Tax=Pantoea sp. TaxID=69393 RepID=UPI00239B5161|nr:ArsC/Spx/MgsR family protein [Pantoea sp.]MDE1188881.1 hypothetical protein [Pantoea sp.]
MIHYLVTPPTREALRALTEAMETRVWALLRTNTEPCEQLCLARNSFSDEQLLDAMLAHPIQINRSIVVTPMGIKLCHLS